VQEASVSIDGKPSDPRIALSRAIEAVISGDLETALDGLLSAAD
jgi:hypothetical protein